MSVVQVRLLAPAMLLGLLIFAGCNPMAGIQSSKQVVGKFLGHLQAGEFDDAYDLCSGKCKAVTSREQMSDLWELFGKYHGKSKGWTNSGMKAYAGTGGSSVTLTYQIEGETKNGSASFVLVPEGEKWLIQEFSFGQSARWHATRGTGTIDSQADPPLAAPRWAFGLRKLLVPVGVAALAAAWAASVFRDTFFYFRLN